MNHIKSSINLCNISQTGKNIRIVILDSGVYQHTDLEGRIIVFKDFINRYRIPYDDNGHGTHISGIICGLGTACKGKYTGISQGAELIVLKVLDKNGNGKTNDFINALKWVIENKQRYNIRLLNFSVGFISRTNLYDKKLILDLINQIWDDGIIVVTAAGNNGPDDNTITVPGISRKVITVGAIGEKFSGRGPTECCIVKPEVLAPGSNITSLRNKYNEYIAKSGTSRATPVVCGALALALEKNETLRPIDAKLALYNSVDQTEDDVLCWGNLNVKKLVDYV